MSLRRVVLWNLLTVAAAGLVAFFVAKSTFQSRSPHRHHHSHEHSDFHVWLHEHLQLTEEQSRVLDPIEKRFEEMSKAKEKEIILAGRDLAVAIRNHPHEAPKAVERALTQLHLAQGELQKITLNHFFEMKEHLTPEQGNKLIQWTHDSIIHGKGN